VIERTVRRVHGGDNLNVDLAAIAQAVGCDPRHGAKLPVVRAFRDRHLTTWPALYRWLRDRAGEISAITLEEGRTVVSVSSDGGKARLRKSFFKEVVAGRRSPGPPDLCRSTTPRSG